MKRITRDVFIKAGSKGGSASGPRKKRGTPEYYAELGRKSGLARRKAKEAQNAN